MMDKTANPGGALPNLFASAFEYLVDSGQRTVLFLDVMRQRGEQYREHMAETVPHVLNYSVELVADGRNLKTLIPDLLKRNPNKEFELKFTIRRSPAHMGGRMGEHNLVRWLDSFIFFNMMNGEIDKLHKKWLGMPLSPLPTL